jgi:uncharacterized membrane protein
MISDPILLLAFMFTVVAFTRWLEGRVLFIEKISSAVVCTLLGITFANLGVIPFTSTMQEAVYDFAVPYAIVLVILGSDLKQLAGAGRPMILAYLFAGAGSFVGGAVAGIVLSGWVGPETWKLSGAFSGAFTGGGMNFAAVGRGLEIDAGTFAAAAVADNLSTVPYLLTQVALVGVLGPIFARRLGATGVAPGVNMSDTTSRAQDVEEGEPEAIDEVRRAWTETTMSITDIAVLGALPLLALWIARQLAEQLPAIPEVLWLTTFAMVVAQIPTIKRLRGAAVVSYFALHVFFIVLGSSSILSEVVKAGLPIFSLMIAIILLHMLVAYGLGWLARIDLSTISVASQAAIGGPGSALAISMAMKWNQLVTPGVIVGIFGYALGNYLGFACAYLVAALT